MELKREKSRPTKTIHPCLNRTFYGIETFLRMLKDYEFNCLNRTFYGIETGRLHDIDEPLHVVLIVPFMELKLEFEEVSSLNSTVLIVPFMELKPDEAHFVDFDLGS